MGEKSLALRRHHAERVKENRAKDLVLSSDSGKPASDRVLGKQAHTPAACSCHMCGNPRKFFGEQTIQERRFDQVEHQHSVDV